jgi:probable phosphoglycerate mutase
MIVLMRHGESPVNITLTLSCRNVDDPLTETGVRQARLAAEWLADRPIRQIYASPLKRAQETAGIAAQRLGLGYTVAEELREIDCGALEGRSDPEAWNSFQNVVLRWVSGDLEAGFEGGETGRHAVDRFARFVRGLPEGEGDILAVGHGGIFAMGLLRLCFDLKPASGHDLYLANTGIILVDQTPHGYSCVKWGLSDHLDQPSPMDLPDGILE